MKVQQTGVVLGSLLAVGLICSNASCGGGSPAAVSPANNSSVVSAPAITVTVSPSATTVFTSLTAQFSATVTGTANTAVTWAVNGVAGGNQSLGTINDSGLYTAPALVPIPATVMVTATSVASPSSSANAQVRVATPIGIVLSPENLTLLAGQTQYFTASVTGPEDSGVAWSVNGIPGGNTSVGTLTTTTQVNGRSFTGQYIAPNVPPFADPVIVQAISTVDPAAAAAAHVTIPWDTQLAQGTPIKLGTSGGNASDVQLVNGSIGGCCSGTLGALLSRGGNFYILSNNHVLDKLDQGSIGDPIIQPGLGDANCQAGETVTVAHLSQAPSLHGAPNVDAAIAAIVPGAVDTSGTILDLAAPNQPAPPSSALANPQTAFSTKEPVAKVGRSSGLTCSTIASVAANVIVQYPTSCGSTTSFQVTYTNQIVIDGSFGEPGDSGSLVVTADTARPLGLLYGGNGSSAIANPIQDVLSALQDFSTGEVPKMVGSADHAVACPNAGLASIQNTQMAITTQLDAKALQRAAVAKTQYESQLMQNVAVSSVSIGNSEDDPVQPALVVHVKGALQAPLPHQLGAVRTRVVFDQTPSIRAALSQSELARAIQVKARHSAELMSNSKVFGVGVGASKDSPGEAAIAIYIDRDSQLSMPLEMDGTRTQIVRTDPFRTSGWGKEVKKACSKPITNSGSAVRTAGAH